MVVRGDNRSVDPPSLHNFNAATLNFAVDCWVCGPYKGGINNGATHVTKQPKRTIRRNIWGNLVGYEGGKRAEEFGDAFSEWNKAEAQAWVERREA